MNGFECGDELRAKTVLEIDLLSVDLLRNKNDLFVFNVHTLNRANTFREIEDLDTAKWFSGVPTATIFPNDGWVEALFDSGPDREGGCKVVAFDDNVRTVENSDGIDTTEKIIIGIACKYITHAGFDAHTDKCVDSALTPIPVTRELLIA